MMLGKVWVICFTGVLEILVAARRAIAVLVHKGFCACRKLVLLGLYSYCLSLGPCDFFFVRKKMIVRLQGKRGEGGGWEDAGCGGVRAMRYAASYVISF